MAQIIRSLYGGYALIPKHGRSTKEFQDFFTPDAVAQELAACMLAQIEDYSVVLDPAVGSGALIWPLLAGGKPLTVLCMDIQQDYIQHVAEEAIKKGYAVEKTHFGVSIKNHR